MAPPTTPLAPNPTGKQPDPTGKQGDKTANADTLKAINEKKPLVPGEKGTHPNLPPRIKDILGTPAEDKVRIWKENYDRGISFKCKEKGCYYPVDNKRNAAGHNAVTKDGLLIMQCTWDKTHGPGDPINDEGHKEQLFTPPSKKNEDLSALEE